MEIWLILSVLVAHFLAVSSQSYTLSSKLYHRFSDETRAVFHQTVETNLSWPSRGSIQYYEILVNSDFQKQKLRLGSKYPLLFPSEGSKTMSFGNDFGWLHYTWIDIGTPNVSFLVALDAGSDLLWVPCDCIECASLTAQSYNLDRDLNEYSPDSSRTSKLLSCNHRLCTLGHNCENLNQPCPYIVNYLSENTSSSGFLVEDVMHLISNNAHPSKSSVQVPVILGCGRRQTGGYLNGIAPDGLLGLGFSEISVPNFLAKSGLVRNSFSICFNNDDSGTIFFGDLGPSNQQTSPFLPLNGKYSTYIIGVEGICIGNDCLQQTGFQALVDSGTSFTFLPHSVYRIISSEFNKQINATRKIYEDSPWDYCYQASSKNMPKIPTVTLTFASNGSFVVYKPTFEYHGGGDSVAFCLALQPTNADFGIIGQNLMTGYRLVFDRENLNLGWSTSNCESMDDNDREMMSTPPHVKPENPLPTNQQQSTPPTNTRAVPPATAGRASSDHSGTSSLILFQFSFQKILLLFISVSMI